eukprot:Polyplicarium_translucidae@DN1218_c0_g1_i2.p1
MITNDMGAQPMADEEEDEDLLIQKVIEQHAAHRGPFGGAATVPRPIGRGKSNVWTRKDQDTSIMKRSLPVPMTPAQRKWKWQPTGAMMRPGLVPRRDVNGAAPGSAERIRVRPDYVCHLCGEKGHHIRNCPKGKDRRHQKKIKPATGIPRSWLQIVPREALSTIDEEVYILPDGAFAVLKEREAISSDAFFARSLEQRIRERLGSEASAAGAGSALHCSQCGQLFRRPVLMSCCGSTFCRPCCEVGSPPSTGAALGARERAGHRTATSPPSHAEEGWAPPPGGATFPHEGDVTALTPLQRILLMSQSLKAESDVEPPGVDFKVTPPSYSCPGCGVASSEGDILPNRTAAAAVEALLLARSTVPLRAPPRAAAAARPTPSPPALSRTAKKEMP